MRKLRSVRESPPRPSYIHSESQDPPPDVRSGLPEDVQRAYHRRHKLGDQTSATSSRHPFVGRAIDALAFWRGGAGSGAFICAQEDRCACHWIPFPP